MTDQPMLPGMPVPDAPHFFIATVTESNIALIAKESGKTEDELRLLMRGRHEQGKECVVRYLSDNYHNHKPRQHRDGKQRWCDVCGLTGDGMVPESKLTKEN